MNQTPQTTVLVCGSVDGTFNPGVGNLIPLRCDVNGFLLCINNAVNVAMTITSNLNPSIFGQSVQFVSGVSQDVGTVTFSDGATSLATTSLSFGQSTFSSSILSTATHTIKATYSGDEFVSTTTVSLLQTVNQASSSSVVTSAVSAGPQVAVVSPQYSGTPTGTVTFKDNGSSIGTAGLSSGTASLAHTSTISHTITAIYAGDTNFASSTAAGVVELV